MQPDASFIGLTSAYRLAQIYHRAGLPCIPHSWTNAIAHAANAHLVAAIPNRVMLETQHIGNPMLTELVDHPIPVNQGFIDVPERPGLGIELNHGCGAALSLHRERHLRALATLGMIPRAIVSTHSRSVTKSNKLGHTGI